MPDHESSDKDPIPPKELFELESLPPRHASQGSRGDAADRETYDLHEDHEQPAITESPMVEAIPLTDTAARPGDRPRYVPPPPEEPTWPDTLGSICMILAIFGLLVHGLVIAGYTLDLTGGWEQLGRERPEVNYFTLIPNLFIEVVLLGLELMLLYGGLAMKMRWISAVAALRGWAMLKIGVVVIRLLRDWGLLIVPIYKMLTNQPPDSTWGHYQTAFMLFWSFVMLAWGLLLPVFLLLMFKRKSVQEELATW